MTNYQAQCDQGPSMDETVVTSLASGLAALLLERTLKEGKDVKIEGMGTILGEKQNERQGQRVTDATA